MLGWLGAVLFVAANLLALVLIPLGLPGLWLQVAAGTAAAVVGGGAHFGWGWVALLLALALLGEGVEFLSGQWGARRFGGSRRAAWGALVGGIVGAIVGGIPVPVVGAIVMSFVGTFAGAILGEMSEQRSTRPDLHVGVGAVVGRAIGVGTKLFLGVVMAIVAATVFFG